MFFNDGPRRFTPVPFGDARGIAYGITVPDLNADGLQDRARLAGLLLASLNSDLDAAPATAIEDAWREEATI